MDPETTPVVVAACRTPQGKQDGALADLRSEDLSIPLVEHVLAETGLAGEQVDDLRWGCAQQRDEQGNNLARVIALLSELGESTPATTINRWCASSAEAIAGAADAIAAGQRDCVLAGGVESMSRVPLGGNTNSLHPRLNEVYNVAELEMGMTAETVASEHDVSRRAQDEYGYRSHRRAAAATDEGRFEDELVPVGTDDGRLEEDEGIRRETSVEAMSDLQPVYRSDGTVTAGNASQVSDGAAGLLVTSRAFADENGLDELATVGRHEVAGVDPHVMGIGPIPATRALLERAGRGIGEYDLVELNEAFAAQTIHCRRELEIPEERFNVNGGAIAIGHPLGASGARLPVTLLHEMARRGADRGIATECVGFGQGMAIEFTR
jgi:acetyl-CoA acetyltransferase family protein